MTSLLEINSAMSSVRKMSRVYTLSFKSIQKYEQSHWAPHLAGYVDWRPASNVPPPSTSFHPPGKRSRSESRFKAEVGSLLLVSSCKNPITIFQHVVTQVVWQNTRLLHLCLTLQTVTGTFSDNHGHFRECVFLLAVLQSQIHVHVLSDNQIQWIQWPTNRERDLLSQL